MSLASEAWVAEILACRPQGSDYTEIARWIAGGDDWREFLCQDEESKEALNAWEAFIQIRGIAVPIEQVALDGLPLDFQAVAVRLKDCPSRWHQPTLEFLRCAPEEVRDYLVAFHADLVQTERRRRTGALSWSPAAVSGSPEVLQELMFKWGPRFRRHRWSW